jgi:hypothetical protein
MSKKSLDPLLLDYGKYTNNGILTFFVKFYNRIYHKYHPAGVCFQRQWVKLTQCMVKIALRPTF